MGKMKPINGTYIKSLREDKELSQAEVAELIKTDQTTVSSWERGEVSPSRENRQKLADLYGVGVEDFTSGAESAPPLESFEELRRVVRQEVRDLLEAERKVILPLLKRIDRATGGKRFKKPEEEPYFESTELRLVLPDPPAGLGRDDLKRWTGNAETLKRWGETQAASRDFPHGVPGWAVEKFCRQAVGFYEGGSLKDVSGVLLDFIEEGKRE